MKRIQLAIPCIYERAFSYFSCIKLHYFTQFKPKIFWGGPPDHLTNTFPISKLPCHLCVCVEKGLQSTQDHALPKINLYVNNCHESRFKPHFCRKERSTATLFSSVSSPHCFLFFFCLSKCLEIWTPLTKSPESAPYSPLFPYEH